ncbi:hypothetical protein Scep_021585 [Stephania cephalantha]|uniref:Uncharacterized protein n=1 Tax=Stephania cephalantha TaxID=152367 RepID=A0AAP0F4U7_9MAGN
MAVVAATRAVAGSRDYTMETTAAAAAAGEAANGSRRGVSAAVCAGGMRGERRDDVVGPIAPRRGVRIDECRRSDGGVGCAYRDASECIFEAVRGKPGERKWGHPPKGSWGYGNQVKGSWGIHRKDHRGSTYSLV